MLQLEAPHVIYHAVRQAMTIAANMRSLLRRDAEFGS
jgi:hypothetical protein